MGIAIVAILSGSVITIVKSVLAYRKDVRQGSRPEISSRSSVSEGASLTTSELEGMMRRAVSDATAPLADRIELLESRMSGSIGPREADELPERSEPVRKTIGTRSG
jgi:hypothetical protein